MYAEHALNETTYARQHVSTEERTQPSKGPRGRKQDPIFQLIEQHKAAWAAFEGITGKEDETPKDSPEYRAVRKEYDRLHRAECRAFRRMVKTVPATRVGFAAWIDYLSSGGVWNSFDNYGTEGALDDFIGAVRTFGTTPRSDAKMIAVLERFLPLREANYEADRKASSLRVDRPNDKSAIAAAEAELERTSKARDAAWYALARLPAQTSVGAVIKLAFVEDFEIEELQYTKHDPQSAADFQLGVFRDLLQQAERDNPEEFAKVWAIIRAWWTDQRETSGKETGQRAA